MKKIMMKSLEEFVQKLPKEPLNDLLRKSLHEFLLESLEFIPQESAINFLLKLPSPGGSLRKFLKGFFLKIFEELLQTSYQSFNEKFFQGFVQKKVLVFLKNIVHELHNNYFSDSSRRSSMYLFWKYFRNAS